MSKEKQIDIITDLLIDFDEMGFAPTTIVPDPDAYAREWRDKLTDALQGYRKQNEWISVDEGLPEESGYYLVTIINHFGNNFVSFTYYSKTYGWDMLEDITHWMPLPEAPKMRKEDEGK